MREISLDIIEDVPLIYDVAAHRSCGSNCRRAHTWPSAVRRSFKPKPCSRLIVRIRGANVVRQLSRPDARRGWTSAPATRHKVALAARGGSAGIRDGQDTPAAKIAAIERLGARIVRATYDECWRTVEAHGSRG
jgi:hypothetical protein